MARADAHPLYRTTAGFDYGRYLDFKDVALSCPKHAKPAKFTKEFIAGTFTDTSLTSIDKSKLRAECWQRKVAERTAQMQIKHEELQHVLEVKKQVRKHARDQKRREMETKNRAAAVIQARIRGIQMRARLHKEAHRRYTIAALKIQQMCRSRAKVHRAKAILIAKKREKLDVFALKIQRIQRDYILRVDAKRQLAERRKHKVLEAEELEKRFLEIQDDAARDIQRLVRGYLARRMHRQFSTTSTFSDKEEFLKDYYYVGSGSKSKITRKALVSLRRNKRDKSLHRISPTAMK
uniref:Uncharacterized protein n=1 Tax=Globisporangium ultimum (strain ATCC 200006 / CBS 805.95 / DAOM BR144) TaxID=431595 RepID=K3WZW4_GLOUD